MTGMEKTLFIWRAMAVSLPRAYSPPDITAAVAFADDLTPDLATPDVLQFNVLRDDIEMMYTSKRTVRQVLSRQVLADIITETDYKYRIVFYRSQDKGMKTDGIYQPISRTFIDRAAKTVTQTVDSPDSDIDTQSITVNGLLQSSRTMTGLTYLRLRRLEPAYDNPRKRSSTCAAR